MCLEVFIAADKPLPILTFDPAAPAFSVTELWPALAHVRKQFSKPFVYDVASHEGCACAFQNDPYSFNIVRDPDVPEDAKQDFRDNDNFWLEAVAWFRAYLSDALREAGPIELFTCWADDEGAEPVTRRTVTADYFSDEAFGFEEKQFFTVSA